MSVVNVSELPWHSMQARRTPLVDVCVYLGFAAILGGIAGCAPRTGAAAPWSCYREEHPVGAAADCTEYRAGYSAESALAACDAVGGALSERVGCPADAIAHCAVSIGGRAATLFYYDDVDGDEARAGCEAVDGTWMMD